MNSKQSENEKFRNGTDGRSPVQLTRIDLNCDLGEGMGNDEGIMPFITSASIACGYHAGNENTMRAAIELAIKNKVAVGAHVSFFDQKNFGRSEINLPAREIFGLVEQQLIIMEKITTSLGKRINHVKPHGALYNMSARDPVVARVIAEAVKDFHPGLILFGLSGSASVREAELIGLHTASEIFGDRRYTDEGSLVPRPQTGALIEDAGEAVQQVLKMVKEGMVTSVSGREIPVKADTVCIHGDSKDAAELARRIHESLTKNGVLIDALTR